MLRLKELGEEIQTARAIKATGKVVGVKGPLVLANLPYCRLGEVCSIGMRGRPSLLAQVLSFEGETVSLAPFDALEGISPGAPVECLGRGACINVDGCLVGRVVNAMGESISYSGASTQGFLQSLRNAPPSPLSRPPIREFFHTGIKAIDGLCTLGVGQRLGLMAGAGLGKSTLLGMVAKNATADVVVIGLIGERGREVNEFLLRVLGAEGLRRAVVVVSTSDEPAVRRALAAQTATAIAEYFRDQGKNVLLLIDSLTRTARAIREMTLAAGELPVRHGYTPSVYAALPQLLERSGTSARGSITAIYTILSYGDNEHDPLAEEAKSILDGHIVLAGQIAEQGIRPAIDISQSISRLLPALHDEETLADIELVRMIIGKIKHEKDLVLLGGTPDSGLKAALTLEERVKGFLRQPIGSDWPWIETVREVKAIAGEYRRLRGDEDPRP